MVDIRIYRATFVLPLLALVVVMFSLQERPRPLTSTLAPDAFDGRAAFTTTREIVESHAQRRAGSAGAEALAGVVEGRLQSLGFETTRDEFSAESNGDSVTMTNVLGVLSGQSDRQLVVLAHRDAAEPPGASSASSTAVLLELARATAAARHDRTLVFVSTDGGEAGLAGARRFADEYGDAAKVDGALVIDDPAAARPKKPYLIPWSTGSGRGSLQVLRTAEAALEREAAVEAGSESALGQFVHQAWPLTLHEQGPLVRAGLDAVTLTSRGEVPRPPGEASLDSISRLRTGNFGKAALGTLLALDATASVEPSPPGYLALGRQVLPEWAVALLVLALVLPALVTGVDAFARARRRGRPVEHWMRWAAGMIVPFLVVVVAVRIFQLLDWLPANAAEALAPATRPSFAESAPAVAALALLLVLSWVALRPLVSGRAVAPRRPEVPEAAVATALLLAGEMLLLWAGNPFAALLLVPALHLCLLTALPEGPHRRLLLTMAVGAALLLPAIVLTYYGARLDLGFNLVRHLLLVLTGSESSWDAVLGSLIAGTLVATVVVALARPPRESADRITVRGPSSYAGPGSLGGTESALRR